MQLYKLTKPPFAGGTGGIVETLLLRNVSRICQIIPLSLKRSGGRAKLTSSPGINASVIHSYRYEWFPLSTTRLTLRSFLTNAEVDVSRGVKRSRVPHGTKSKLKYVDCGIPVSIQYKSTMRTFMSSCTQRLLDNFPTIMSNHEKAVLEGRGFRPNFSVISRSNLTNYQEMTPVVT